MENRSFNSLVEQFLGERLPGRLADGVDFPGLPAQARQFILRMLALMKRASHPVTEFNPHVIQMLSDFVPNALPSAWGGRIPPITNPGRHAKLDEYVAKQKWPPGNGRPVFIDLGCGFPPVTTGDTARNMPDWRIYGVDRSFARHVLYDADGHYACFNRDGEYLYFQGTMKRSGRALSQHRDSTRALFEKRFAELCPRLEASDGETSQTVEKDGVRLVRDHIRDFETDNLTFIESEIEGVKAPPARVVRCMNVLLYFEPAVRESMMASIGALLDDDGLVISGTNQFTGRSSRYFVHRKDASGVTLLEFTFSLSCLRPVGVMPWYSIHENDPEVERLAELTGAIRADPVFWPEFNRRVDALFEKHGIFRRGEDGFNHPMEEVLTMPLNVITDKIAALWRRIDAEGFTDGAVDALARAGFDAWKNPIDDIAVRPSGATRDKIPTEHAK